MEAPRYEVSIRCSRMDTVPEGRCLIASQVLFALPQISTPRIDPIPFVPLPSWPHTASLGFKQQPITDIDMKHTFVRQSLRLFHQSFRYSKMMIVWLSQLL